MPGTIPAITDPIVVTSAASNTDTKAAVTSDMSPPTVAAPSGHPAAGVASAGAAQLTASTAPGAALAPTNAPAQMTAQPTSGPLHRQQEKKDKEDRELKKFVEAPGHFSLVRNFHLADAFTLMNGFCGAQSLFASGRYLITSDPSHAWAALWFPFFGAIFDLLDGKVARWRNSSSMLGQELDSLADSLSFGAAPAFAAFALGLRLPLDTLFLTLFVCAGIARLARFNVTTASIPHDSSGKARYFEGLPIPSSLALVGGMALCLLAGRVEPGGAAFAASAASKLPFTGALADKLPGTGVPLGTFSLDLRPLVQQVAVALPTSVGKHLQNLDGVVEVHKLALLWGAWAMAMVSKTLRVPKP